MKVLLISLVLFLSACTSIPVQRNFPSIPSELKESCPDLKTIPENSKMSDVIDVVVSNYGQYKECQIKVDAWIKWYNDQQKIFNGVN